MRILFITAYYPPCEKGWGYMRLCESVANALHARGHEVAVLTSVCGDGESPAPYPVYRLLEIDPDWDCRTPVPVQFLVHRKRREQAALSHFERLASEFQPDIVFVWHGHGLSRRMFQQAERRSGSVVVYYLANYLPEVPDEYIRYWSYPGRKPVVRWVKRLVGRWALARLRKEGYPVSLAYEHTIHVSDHVHRRLKSAGLIGPDSITIPNGCDVEALDALKVPPRTPATPLRMIVAGRISPEKGVHTALQALALARDALGPDLLHLTLLGNGPKGYLQRLHQLVKDLKLEENIRFCDPLPLEQYRRELAAHDVLLFPSVWDEPLSTAMMEALALDLLVIGTAVGGSGEVLRHEDTGLVAVPGDEHDLANQIVRAARNREELACISARGRSFIREHYTLRRTIDRIERHLQGLLAETS